ncbi:hypothetical protein [Acuticoccus sp. I52.16.1]|uniref:hypothetical protein n=1 Tax=Acuticoccus sp. I52.16.1 TaxID=2928472 RepID=UPI001FCF9546|nr:hypothetical protein [Acuticoccus sp. I52.16.1]UOM34976.1 hypothetical protein MRB58_01815 [Acuticoccus sp. I52.16.1]
MRALLAATLVAIAAGPAVPSAAQTLAPYRLTPDAPPGGPRYCKHFPSYRDAAAYCLATFGTTVGCGGLDRDRDGLPCECNAGGAEADTRACQRWRRDNQ